MGVNEQNRKRDEKRKKLEASREMWIKTKIKDKQKLQVMAEMQRLRKAQEEQYRNALLLGKQREDEQRKFDAVNMRRQIQNSKRKKKIPLMLPRELIAVTRGRTEVAQKPDAMLQPPPARQMLDNYNA